MWPFNRLQELPTIRLLQLEGVTVGRRPEGINGYDLCQIWF